jgi:fructose-bisphosphate aldolase class I
VVDQHIEIVHRICETGRAPILGPEVDIASPETQAVENLLRDPLANHPSIEIPIGYTREEATKRLACNHGMIASFSRALIEGLKVSMTDDEFGAELHSSIEQICTASIT